ncbi:hypothetical protein BSL78_23071 [Apostichopus japonicus]|uniref:Uncharacterized protein n=1 Tax=Stichopus japonicus TaxID=307972 RepID=A0A2G8JWJ4_STIJA|nr:hypothetical protein BSL78_23071 [Apostichopus japonicus]
MFAFDMFVSDSKSTKKPVLADQLNTLKDKVQDLSHKLTESEYEKQQLTGRPKKERQRFNDKPAISEVEKHQNIGRLKFAEEERRLSDKVTESENEKQHFKGRLNTTEEERQQFKDALNTTEEGRQQLKDTLNTTEEGRQQLKDTLNTTENKLKTLKDETEELLQQQKEELEEAKSSLRATKDELVKSQPEYAKESMALQRVLKQSREALNQQELTSSTYVTEEDILLGECETLDKSHQSTLAENATPGLTSTNEESNSADLQSLPAMPLSANGIKRLSQPINIKHVA